MASLKHVLASSAVVGALMCGGAASHAQTATPPPTAVLTNPPDGATYTVYFRLGAQSASVPVSGKTSVSATGAANANFPVNWNMWLKVGSNSVLPNNTSNGVVQQSFNGTGNWTQSWSPSVTVALGPGTYTAEAAAFITLGTTTTSQLDRHTFYVKGDT